MKNLIREVNLDAMVGPTHHFGGLSFGNIASTTHEAVLSYPKMAALEGLKKMRYLSQLGILQAVLPPQPRPHFDILRQLGFQGSDQEVAKKAFQEDLFLFLQCSSSSFMWAANSATITASSDAADKKVHITPANLCSHLHRFCEATHTEILMRQIFHDARYFTVHPPLPSASDFSDEGAANQIRFSSSDSSKGLYLFVYGKSQKRERAPKKYPARQAKEVFHAIIRRHALSYDQVVCVQQLPQAIDAGVFHNDVISTGHERFFICHERAFCNQKKVLVELNTKAKALFGTGLAIHLIREKDLSLSDAVRSYLFNSQICTTHEKAILLAPDECKHLTASAHVLERLLKKHIVDELHYVSLSESMKNGGGPACLRIRLPLHEKEIKAMHQGVFLNDAVYASLCDIVHTYYPEKLYLEQFLDPQFRTQCERAYQAIMHALKLTVI